MGGDFLELNPSGTLEFRVASSKSSTTTLTAKNLSEDKAVAVKVKTTQPSWYYVRPNQEILGPGESLDISITLIETESRRSFALHLKGMPLDHSRHRFQVLSAPLTDGLAGEIRGIGDNTDARKKAFMNLWSQVSNQGADDKSGSSSSGPLKSLQLKVQYTYEDSDTLVPSEMGLDEDGRLLDNPMKSKPVVVETVSARVEKMRKEFKEMAEKADYGSKREVPESFESARIMYKKLKKKYVILEDWTIAMTGELDTTRAEVDGINNKITKEKQQAASRKLPPSPGGGSAGDDNSSRSKGGPAPLVDIQRKPNQSLLMAILTMRLSLLIVGAGVVIAYLLGRNTPQVSDLAAFSLANYIKSHEPRDLSL